jgi:hypothetical protein
VQVGEGIDDTRRRVDLTEMLRGQPAQLAAGIAAARDAFADPHVRGWIDSHRTGLLAHQRLSAAATT